MQSLAEAERTAGRRLALVPTMGALHEGHLALVREAQKHADCVTVSIFVNPTQFSPDEDFEAYPRDLQADTLKLEGIADAVFAPTAEEMYPFGVPPYFSMNIRNLNRHLCGAFREGHFEGVATVVAKLFLACRPHVAVFGKKDAQQLVIIRRMAEELGFGIKIIGHSIVREADGLALSSRNQYLNPEERRQAVVLSESLREAKAAIERGERDADTLRKQIQSHIKTQPLAEVQYAEIVDSETLQPVKVLKTGQYLVALAVFVGETRLIDNTTLYLEEPTA